MIEYGLSFLQQEYDSYGVLQATCRQLRQARQHYQDHAIYALLNDGKPMPCEPCEVYWAREDAEEQARIADFIEGFGEGWTIPAA